MQYSRLPPSRMRDEKKERRKIERESGQTKSQIQMAPKWPPALLQAGTEAVGVTVDQWVNAAVMVPTETVHVVVTESLVLVNWGAVTVDQASP